MRTQIEADLIVQNLFLTADAIGLGAWIHGTILPPVLLGDPKFRKTYGKMLDFDLWCRNGNSGIYCAGKCRFQNSPIFAPSGGVAA